MRQVWKQFETHYDSPTYNKFPLFSADLIITRITYAHSPNSINRCNWFKMFVPAANREIRQKANPPKEFSLSRKVLARSFTYKNRREMLIGLFEFLKLDPVGTRCVA